MTNKYYANYPSVEELRAAFSYCPETGSITRIECFHKYRLGEAGGPTSDGYLRVMLNRIEMRAHVAAWMLFHGELPPEGFTVDHINGNKLDNRIVNLRVGDARLQASNRQKNRDGHLVGTTFDKDLGRWVAKFSHSQEDGSRKEFFLGYFDNPEDAHKAYLEATENVKDTVATLTEERLAAKSKFQSGVTGVKWHKDHEKWAVSISVNRKNRHLGYYDTITEAEKIFNQINPIKAEYVAWLEAEKLRTGKKAIFDGAYKFLADRKAAKKNKKIS